MEAAAIRLENVSFGYHGSQVLREINFSVQKGEHIGIVGTSGCGKSTLLKLISGPVSYTHLDVYKRQEDEWLFQRFC